MGSGGTSPDKLEADRAWIASVITQLGRWGPLAFRRLPASEQAWRGLCCLMIASLGASPMLAWGCAMESDRNGSMAGTRALVAATDDAAIAATLRANGSRVEDLRVG